MKCHHWTVTAKRTRSARLPLKLIINLNSLHLIKQVQTVRTTESIKAEPTCDSVFVNNLTREPCLPSHLYQLSPALRWLFMQKICVFCPGKVPSGQSQLVCEVAKNRENSYFKDSGGIAAAEINTILALPLSNLSKLVQQQKFWLCHAGSVWCHHPRKAPPWVTFYDRNQTHWS